MLAVSDNSILVYCFYNLNTINLPGQARDKRRESTQEDDPFSYRCFKRCTSSRTQRQSQSAVAGSGGAQQMPFLCHIFLIETQRSFAKTGSGINKTEAGRGSQRENVCCRRPPAAPLCPLKTDDAGASAHWTAPSASALQLQVRKTLRRFSRRFLLVGTKNDHLPRHARDKLRGRWLKRVAFSGAGGAGSCHCEREHLLVQHSPGCLRLWLGIV